MTTLGTLGDLHPMIAIALELRQRGHDIVFATHQVYQSRIEALGFEFHSMRPNFTAMNVEILKLSTPGMIYRVTSV
jgi:rhamnosyltransferase subunit B